MNEEEFRKKWHDEKDIYAAYGLFIVREIEELLVQRGYQLDEFLKIRGSRVKTEESLVDKAFNRKSYDDPYEEVEDKVGVRFVVLLQSELTELQEVIRSSEKWIVEESRNFIDERKQEPLLFTYQSVHYIVRNTEELLMNGTIIPAGLPCEVQLRTLLQHAHAELTHDAIYKAKRDIQPDVHRIVAKSMALIETTDDFFGQVVTKINDGPLESLGIVEQLDGLYQSNTSIKPVNQKSAVAVWEAYPEVLNEDLVDNVQNYVNQNPGLNEIIHGRYSDHAFYHQSVVLFVYWMLRNRRTMLRDNWPLQQTLLDMLANDIGVAIGS